MNEYKIDRLTKKPNILAGAPTNFPELPVWDSCASYENGTPVIFNEDKFYAFEVGAAPSRFMPNVAFLVNKDDYSQLDLDFITEHEEAVIQTDENGDIDRILFNTVFNDLNLVSKYLAAPELVPEGMFYDKDSDSLCPFATGGTLPDGFHNSCLDSAKNCMTLLKKYFKE